MGVGSDQGKSSGVRASDQAGRGGGAGQVEQGLAAWHGAEHPEAGGIEVTYVIGYPIIVEQADDGGFGAWSPDLPGCVALGESVDECLAEMRDAVALYLDVLRERGEEVPQPRVIQAVTVTPAA